VRWAVRPGAFVNMIETTLPQAPELGAAAPAPDRAPLVEWMATLLLESAVLRAQNAVLQARVRELETRPGQHSSNSSPPPSSDSVPVPTKRRAAPSARSRARGTNLPDVTTFIFTEKVGRYAVASDDERHGWVVVEQESRRVVFPDRIYGTALAALHAAIARAAAENNRGPSLAPDSPGAANTKLSATD
jgi:hypothetical protein